jgi:5-formyltetrahydrofolate cyclo-ligase
MQQSLPIKARTGLCWEPRAYLPAADAISNRRCPHLSKPSLLNGNSSEVFMPAGDPHAEKAALRKRFLEMRRALTDTKTRSARIRRHLEFLKAYENAPMVMTYVSKPDEVDTHELIKDELERGRVILVPAALPDGELAWSRLQSFADLAPSRFDVLEPRPDGDSSSLSPFSNTSVVLVPGVVFSRTGFRIGHGGGYFDRFLSNFAGVPVGLAFECQVIDDLPREPHDRPVQWLITESGCVECRSA